MALSGAAVEEYGRAMTAILDSASLSATRPVEPAPPARSEPPSGSASPAPSVAGSPGGSTPRRSAPSVEPAPPAQRAQAAQAAEPAWPSLPAQAAQSVGLARARSALFLPPALVSAGPAPAQPAGASARSPVLSVRGRQVPVATAIRGYGVALLGLLALAVAVQPATDAPAVWWSVLLSELAYNGVLVVLAGSLLARRWAAPAGLACAVLFLGLSVSCPLSGHHAYAAWWGVQLTAGAAMVALSAVTLRATRRRR